MKILSVSHIAGIASLMAFVAGSLSSTGAAAPRAEPSASPTDNPSLLRQGTSPTGQPPIGAPGEGAAQPARGRVKRETAEQARCKAEVADAFAAQRDRGSFEMKTRTIDQRGVVFMTLQYQLPNRMRQRVKVLTSPEATETLLVAGRAWTRLGETAQWQALKPEQAGALLDQMGETVVNPDADPLRYRCTDDISDGGQTLRTYQGWQVSPLGKKEPNSPLRIVHVDDATGLPVMNAVASEKRLDRPYFKATFAYPDKLQIDPPKS